MKMIFFKIIIIRKLCANLQKKWDSETKVIKESCINNKCYQLFWFFFVEKTCEPHHFKCGNGKCIPDTWTCDNANDCGDNTDETTPWLHCPVIQDCDSEHFQCEKSKQCILRYLHCDGHKDCGADDDSDERNCGMLNLKILD